jgi:hypothetical protein
VEMRVWNVVGTENAQEMCPAMPVPTVRGETPQGIKAVSIRCDCGRWTTARVSEQGPVHCSCQRHIADVQD